MKVSPSLLNGVIYFKNASNSQKFHDGGFKKLLAIVFHLVKASATTSQQIRGNVIPKDVSFYSLPSYLLRSLGSISVENNLKYDSYTRIKYA